MGTVALLPAETGIGVLCLLNESGDTRVQWNRNNQGEVNAAKAEFNRLKAAGHLAYLVDSSGRKREVVDTFDPTAERLVLIPPSVGG